MSIDNTPSVQQREFKRYEGEDAHPEIEPTVAVRKTAVDYANEEAVLDAEVGLAPKGEDETWKDRYGNLRRLDQQKDKRHKAEMKAVNDRLIQLESSLLEAKKQTGGFIPTSENELAEWSKQNPDAYKIIRSIAANEKENEISTLKLEIERLREEANDSAAETAVKMLEAKHPDMKELAQDKGFWEWVDEQPASWRHYLTNSFNLEEADRILRTYKLEMGITSSKPKKDNSKLAAAMDVSTRGSMPQVDASRNYLFRESDIKKMGDVEYEAKEPEITKAYKEGKVMLDVTNRTQIRA